MTAVMMPSSFSEEWRESSGNEHWTGGFNRIQECLGSVTGGLVKASGLLRINNHSFGGHFSNWEWG